MVAARTPRNRLMSGLKENDHTKCTKPKPGDKVAKKDAIFKKIKAEIEMAFRKIGITDQRHIWEEDEIDNREGILLSR